MANKPEFLNTDNPYGIEFYGPAGADDPVSLYTKHLTSGYDVSLTKDGNKGEIVPGTCHEHIKGQMPGDDRKQKEDGKISKSITVEQGDFALTCENGDIYLKARNIYITATGEGNHGSFMVNANEAITMNAGELLTISGGKVCVRSADSIALNADGLLYFLCADISQSPLSGVLPAFIPKELKRLIEGIAVSCK